MPTKIRPLNQSATQVQANAKAEKARKEASKLQLVIQLVRDAAKSDEALALVLEGYADDDLLALLERGAIGKVSTAKAAAGKLVAYVRQIEAAQRETQAAYEVEDERVALRADRAAKEARNAREALWLDFCAVNDLNPYGGDPVRSVYGDAFVAYLAAQGFGPNGYPLEDALASAGKPKYTGPMLALRERSKRGAYVKGENGNPHCGDAVADALQKLSREQVVAVCIQALGLGHNPYLHLNPGQQSMNLRNKLRHAVRNGFVQMVAVAALANAAAK